MRRKIILIIFSMLTTVLALFNFRMSAEAATKAQIIIEEYSFSGDIIEGEDTTITLTLKNTSAYYPVSDLLLSYSSDNNNVIPTEGVSNQTYITGIRPGGSVDITIPIIVLADSKGFASMRFTMEYVSDDTNYTNSSNIFFGVEREVKALVVKNVNVPITSSVGASSLLSVSFLNTTGSDIYNVTLTASGDFSGNETLTTIGTVGEGRTSYGEAYVTFDNEGENEVTLLLSYEDKDGEVYTTVVGTYIVNSLKNNNSQNVNTDAENTNIDDANTDSSSYSVPMVLLAIAGGVLIVIVMILTVGALKKRK